jgi:pimeloyl-ACP methyl ester carboxylesterase
MIEPLAESPSPHDSFDVVVPSLPGFGFSSPLRETGVGIGRTAQLWRQLMCDVLGYEKFGAQGNDFGAVITQRLAQEHPEVLVGVHMSRYKRPTGTAAVGAVTVSESDYGPDEAGDYQRNQNGLALAASHIAVHTRDPMSLAAGLNDSPVGLAAWLLERRRAWSDCDGDLKKVYTCDDLITTLCLYWFTGTISSSLRLYWEAAHESPAPSPTTGKVITAPTAVGVLPRDVMAMPRKHAEQDTDLRQWTRYPRGGHFGPAEVPELIVEDLRAFFRPLR